MGGAHHCAGSNHSYLIRVAKGIVTSVEVLKDAKRKGEA